MNNTFSIIISLIVMGIIIIPTIGYQYDIYNTVQLSSIFTISAICILIGLVFSLYHNSQQITFNYRDFLILFFLFFYITDSFTTYTLWNRGSLCLLLLFLTLRCSIQLKYLYFYYAVLIALAILSIWGYLQAMEIVSSQNLHFQITGPYHNPSILGGIMCVLFIVAISGLMQNSPKLFRRKHLFYTACFILFFSLPILVLTYARASWIALLCSICYMLYLCFFKSSSIKKRIIYKSSITCGLIITLCAFYHLKPLSADGRLLIWKVSWQMIKEKPLLGFGKKGFEANYLYYQAKYFESESSENEKYIAGNTHIAFNEIVRITVEHGILGLTGYILFIAWMFLLPLKSDIISNTIRSALFAIVVWSMFSYPNRIFFMMVLYVILCAILLNRYSQEIPKKNCAMMTIPLSIVRFSMVLIILLSTISMSRYFYLYGKFYQLANTSNELVKNLPELAKLQDKMSNEIGVISLYAYVLQQRGENEKLLKVINTLEEIYPTPSLLIQKGDLFLQLNDPIEAEKAYILAANMIPIKQKARYKLVLLYNQIGRKIEATNLARGILNEKVKNYGFETHEMHQHLKKIFPEIL